MGLLVELEGGEMDSRTIVDERCNNLSLRPFGFWVELFGQSIPSTLICDSNFGKIVLQDGLVEVDDKLYR